jgi:hypothetical protein
MTTTEIRTRVRQLRKELADLRACRFPWWGLPWCSGPRSPYHQPILCDGCMVRRWRDRLVAEITREITSLSG